jgi:dolichyl-phosphate beta-glucosyltransferase
MAVDPPRVSLIIPAFNERAVIGATLADVLGWFDTQRISVEVIVSADGADGTRELVASLAATDPRITVIGDSQRRGKGRGLRVAVPLARGTVIGFIDADNKTSITAYEAVERALYEGADLVIGSRRLPGAEIDRQQPHYRQLGSSAFRFVMQSLMGLRGIPDTQCGFKFFRADVARDLFSRQQVDGYMYDVEILMLARRAGYRIAQIPVRWRDDGDSRLNVVSGNIRNVLDILRIRFRRYPPPSSAGSPQRSTSTR